MYGLSVRTDVNCETCFVRSAEIARLVTFRGDHPDVMRHLAAIEHLEARGAKYSNQDFDVLSAAWNFAARAFTTGDAVKVKSWIGRRGKIDGLYVNACGVPCYWVDGGLFDANELEAA